MTVQDLYTIANKADRLDNPFETAQTCKAFDGCMEKHFGKKWMQDDKAEDVAEDIVDVLCVERETAFCVGFKSALQLLFSACSD